MKINKVYRIILYLSILFTLSYEYKFYTPDELFTKLRTEPQAQKNSSYFKEIISLTKEIMKDYIFLNIQKNPPQPAWLKQQYHNKVDIMEELDKIKTENQNVFDFYDAYQSTLGLLKDLHVGTKITNMNYSSYYYSSPIAFNAQYVNGSYVCYIRKHLKDNFYQNIKNGIDLQKMLEANYNKNKTPVESINGLSPFEYIQNYLGSKKATKSRHGTYTNKLSLLNGNSIIFSLIPRIEDLKLNIKYKNGDQIETEFLIYSLTENPTNDTKGFYYSTFELDKQFQKFYDDSIFYSETNEQFENSIESYFRDFEKKYGLNERAKLQTASMEVELKQVPLTWDIEYKNGNNTVFQCKADNDKKINVIKLLSFQIDDTSKPYEKLEECILLIDNNTYPLVIIENHNPGGNGYFVEKFANLVAPLFTFRTYNRFRNKNKYIQMKNGILTTYRDPLTCKPINFDDYFSEFQKINYDDVEDEISKLHFRAKLGVNDAKGVNKIKEKINYKRKPHEIIVFTDGYNYSAGNGFIKFLQKYGAAYIIGFNGNPTIGVNEFDAGQSFTNVFEEGLLNTTYPEIMNNFSRLGIRISSLAYSSIYLDRNEEKLPEEFDPWVVNERIRFYSEFTDSNYNLFVNTALNRFESFKANCSNSAANIKKSVMLMIDEKCSFYYDEHLHGGHPCDSDKIWDKLTCIPSYCDIGYLYNFQTKSCYKDPCTLIEDEDEGDKGSKGGKEDKEENNNKIDPNSELKSVCIIALSVLLFIVILLIIITCARPLFSERKKLPEIEIDEPLFNGAN